LLTLLLKVPDFFVVACVEDLVAICGGLFIVSRFCWLEKPAVAASPKLVLPPIRKSQTAYFKPLEGKFNRGTVD
jgi:hypothetical protein